MKKRIAILGASGYTGRELLRILRAHPRMNATFVMTARPGVDPEPPELSHDPVIEPLDLTKLEQVDGVFLCTPHGAAAELARAALGHGCMVVDLSADFRLRDAAVHAGAYGQDHAPELREAAVYGLTEFARQAVADARLVANPGCYPTAVALPLKPLIDAGLIDLDADVIADCKSGVSGAGKTPKPRTIFGATHDNFLAYGVGDHRHQPEIWQSLGTERVLFVPHLLPVFRGILATLWFRPADGVSLEAVLDRLDATFDAEPFVRIYRRGLPELNRVAMTNFCDIGAAEAHGRIVVVSAIDNLVKGAAGQAIQNMNLMLGLGETDGLLS